MAAFRKRLGKWQVQIRIAGAAPISRTFVLKEDGQRWARETEAKAQRGDIKAGAANLRRITLRQLLERYRDNVTPLKRGRDNEGVMIEMLLREDFVGSSLAALSPESFTAYRDKRLRTVKGTTINHELTLLNHVFTIARTEWGIPIENPFAGIRRAPADLHRDRRLQEGEWAALMAAADECRNAHVRPIIEFAVATGMRRGEILAIHWADVNAQRRTLHIPTTKTGRPRTIPLSSRALVIVEAQRMKELERPFPLTAESFRLAWKRLVKRAGIADLHFHDLRHEAVTRFFEMGLGIAEVALISGHRDPRMLFRYTHLRAEEVAAKLP